MGALFAGIVRAPITSIVIIFEMTNNYAIILPLMAANIVSYAVARRLSPEPIYDALLRQDGIRLPHGGGHRLRKLRVGGAMTPGASDGQEDAWLEGTDPTTPTLHPDQSLESALAVFGRIRVKKLRVVSRKDASRQLGVLTIEGVALAVARAEAAQPD